MGLTPSDFASLRELAMEEFYEANELICCRGVRVSNFVVLLILVAKKKENKKKEKKNIHLLSIFSFSTSFFLLMEVMLLSIEGIHNRCFVLDHLFVGEISLMLDCPPTASVYAGLFAYLLVVIAFFFIFGFHVIVPFVMHPHKTPYFR